MALLAACGDSDAKLEEPYEAPGSEMGSAGTSAMGAAGTSGSGGATQTGLPCDVALVLANNCIPCHTNPPLNGAPVPFLSHADLLQISMIDPMKTEAAEAAIRVVSTGLTPSPMPPPGNTVVPTPLAAASAKVIQDWVAAGTPPGDFTPSAALTKCP